MPEKVKPLEPRQARFVDEYLKDLNAKEAAIRAGYSANSAKQTGYDLLRIDRIADAIKAGAHKRAQRVQLDADTVLRNLLEMASVDLLDAYNDDNTFKRLKDIPPAIRRCIASIETEERFVGTGDDRELVGFVRKVKFYDKKDANVWLGKHLRLFIEQLDLPNNSSLASMLAEAFGRPKP